MTQYYSNKDKTEELGVSQGFGRTRLFLGHRPSNRVFVEVSLKEARARFQPKEHQGLGPRFWGSPSCESGSLASGGEKPYCTCDMCF